jgi:acyl-coenzyme A thioesterase PaaI-like protein
MPKMTASEVTDFMKKVLSQFRLPVAIEELRDGFLRIRVGVTDRDLRPGGTISGPTLMSIAEVEMLKLGKRLAVGQVTIYSAGNDDPVAHATVTYSIPPDAMRSVAPSE